MPVKYTPPGEGDRAYGFAERVKAAIEAHKASRTPEARSAREAQRTLKAHEQNVKRQDAHAHRLEWKDHKGQTIPEHFEHASDNALHYSHYEKHHASAVKKLAELHGRSHRHIAVGLAEDAAAHARDLHLDGAGHTVRGQAGHRQLGKMIVRQAHETGRQG